MQIFRTLRPFAAFLVFCPGLGGAMAQMIDEIVVTADFRERAAADVPASVSVLNSEQIEGLAVQHFEELINAVPNLNWSGDGHRARYFQIRGVGELEQYQGAPNPSVGFLIDDIDFSGIGTIATLFDLQQIEVLRGPQGMRYGANALAGLIYLQSAEPSADWNGRLQLTTAGDNTLAAGVAVGGPIDEAESLLFRLSAHQHRSNGFRDNTFLSRDDSNARDETQLRARFRWLPSDNWQVDLATMYADVDNGYDAFALDNGYAVLSDKPGKDAQTSIGVSLRSEYFGWQDLILTSITALANSDIDFSFDADWGNASSWSPFTYDYTSANNRTRKSLSQEYRLTGANWLLGVYAHKLDDELATLNRGDYYDPFADFADSLDDPFDSRYEARNVALFGQRDITLSPATELATGLRVERRTTRYRDSTGLTAGPSESMWGGDISLKHAYGDSVTGYVSLSRGYKAGGFNLGSVPANRREFSAEVLWSLEGGLKTVLFAGSLQANAAVFVNRRIDQQVRASFQLIAGDPASFVFATVNVDSGETLGLEMDLRWQPAADWMFYASLGLLDADFGDLDAPTLANLSGRAQPHAPSYTFALGGKFEHASGVFARIDVSARDDFYFDVSHDQTSKPYELLHARLGYEANSWTIELWGRNLFDTDYAVRGFYFGNEPPDFPTTLYTRLGDPRQLGLTIEKRF